MFAVLLLVPALMLTGCADTWEPVPSSESQEETTTEVTTEEKTETTTEEETETTTEETETEEETETTTEEETETSAEEVKEELPRFFGLPMEEKLQSVNLKTLSDPESGLFDILTEKTWTGGEVLQMIEHYNFPEKQYLGDLPTDPAKKEEIVNNRNLSVLSAEASVTPSYAILTDNASVRAFPSDLPARDSLDPHAFDYLQESVLNYGEGVVILHESLDQEWIFVQGFNYNGWIRKEKTAVCDFTAFTDYLNPDDFLVVTATEIYFDNRDMRLGTILPLTEKTDEYWKIIKPERTPEGTLFLSELLIEPPEEWSEEHPGFLHEGFIPYSQESLRSFRIRWSARPMAGETETMTMTARRLRGSATAATAFSFRGIPRG